MRISIGQIGLERIFKFRRHHADDLITRTVQLDRLFRTSGLAPNIDNHSEWLITATFALPGRLSSAAIVRPSSGFDSSVEKEIFVYARGPDTLRRSTFIYAEDACSKLLILSNEWLCRHEIVEVAIGGADHLRRNLQLRDPAKKDKQAIKISIRQRANQHRVHQAENRRARSDPQPDA